MAILKAVARKDYLEFVEEIQEKMKKLLAVAILLPILSFSYEINFNKSFSKVVNPDLLTTNINISVEKKDEKSVNIEIEKFNTFLKNTKNINISTIYLVKNLKIK